MARSEHILLADVLVETFDLRSYTLAGKQSGNTNLMFQCVRLCPDNSAEQEVFLRITPRTLRSREQVEAEVEFQSSLASSGLPVAPPLRARDGSLVVDIDEGQHPFTPAGVAVCFLSVGGRPAERPDDLNVKFIEAWAQLLARMHTHVSNSNEPLLETGPTRPWWSEDLVLRTALNDRAPETVVLSKSLHAEVEWIKHLTRSPRNFGLTHADFQISNIHVTEESASGPTRIAVFDFDDSCYHFFVHDVAVAVTQLRKASLDGSLADAAALEAAFLTSYCSARGLDQLEEAQLLEWLPHFVKYRAGLIMCWASDERLRGSLVGPVGEAWFFKSLPLYIKMLEG